ncbi:MAG: hypothetical protein QGG39_12575 [Candidatus Poribacteria bacterium]|nr:hypothetical protein [Candidatus Poribacteria bacterium]
MAPAIAQQAQALLPDQPISYPRATVDYIPKSHSKIPFNFAAVAWDVIDSPEYRQLSDGARVLYLYLCRHVNLTLKQETRGNKEYLLGRTFPKKYDKIAQECWGRNKSTRTIAKYVKELVEAELIEVQAGYGNVYQFVVMSYHQSHQIAEYETNATQREYQIQQAALLNNKRRLLRLEKEQVVEVEAPNLTPEIDEQAAKMESEPAELPSDSSSDLPANSYPINKETITKETPSPNTEPAQLEFHSSSSDHNYQQLKLQTLELWCQQQHKLGNLAPSAGDRYQIMRQDHQLGIDAFVAEAMRLSPDVTPTQALNLLQSCIKIMPKTGGNSRPVGRPGWFLLSASDQYFKRAWANTFDFLPSHWHNQHQSASRRGFNRSRSRASHF